MTDTEPPEDDSSLTTENTHSDLTIAEERFESVICLRDICPARPVVSRW